MLKCMSFGCGVVLKKGLKKNTCEKVLKTIVKSP
jgi:hypothetical protein